MVRPHDRCRHPSKRSLAPRLRRIRHHGQWRSALLRRNIRAPPNKTGHPLPCTVEVDGAVLKVAGRRKHCTYPELASGGPQKLLELEPCSAVFCPRLRPAPGSPRATRSARGSVLWLGETLVGSPFRCGPTRRCWHRLGPRLAGCSTAGAARRRRLQEDQLFPMWTLASKRHPLTTNNSSIPAIPQLDSQDTHHWHYSARQPAIPHVHAPAGARDAPPAPFPV